MSKNISRHVTHLKSKLVENGSPKLPAAADLYDGEIAVNYAKGYETLSIKNDSGDVVTFKASNQYSSATEVNTALQGKADTATTLGGYGITDAKIENGVITLGNQTITPLTSYTATVTSVTTSSTNGAISVNGSDVAVHGLGNAAYLNTGTSANTVAAGNHSHSNYVTTARTISTASGLTGGGNLSTDRTIGLAMPSYSTAATYTSSAATSDEPIVYRVCKASGNLSNQVCPINLKNGQQCNVIYMGSTTAATYTVSISTAYKTPTGSALGTFTVPKNGYVELNYIKLNDTIFVRGV